MSEFILLREGRRNREHWRESYGHEKDSLIEMRRTTYYNQPSSIFLTKIDFLDSKAEVDFQIPMDLGKMTPFDGNSIRKAIIDGRYEACIYILKNKD